MTAAGRRRGRGRRAAYLQPGLALAAATVASLLFGVGGNRLAAGWGADRAFAYSLATGALLSAALLWQWRLSFVRRGGDPERLQRTYRLHRWLGLAPPVLLLAHGGSPGASLPTAMGWLLMAAVLSGLLNPEVVRLRSATARKIWLAIHLGSAASILPLVLLHGWTAFAFKAP